MSAPARTESARALTTGSAPMNSAVSLTMALPPLATTRSTKPPMVGLAQTALVASEPPHSRATVSSPR